MSIAPSPAKPKLYTADDLFRLPSDARFELVKGELRPMAPPPGEEHGSMTFDIGRHVGNFVADGDLGRCYAAETGFLIARDPDTVLAADFAFVARERLTGPPSRKHAAVVPDLVLETRSPSDKARAVEDKVAQWLAAGARMVWELDLKARVLTVHRPGAQPRALRAEDTLDGEDVLPGFTLPLARLFRG